MQIIDTSIVTDPNKQQPFLAPSLNFLQFGIRKVLNALAQGLYGNTIPSYIIIYGCVQTDLGGGNFSYSEGWIYNTSAEQIYFIPAVTTIASANPYVHLVTTQASFDPVEFSDGTTYSVHTDYTYIFNTTSAGALFTFSQLVSSQSSQIYIVGGTGVAFGAGGSVATSTGDSLKYWKTKDGIVHIQGAFLAAGTNGLIFTLPVGYRPTKDGELHYATDYVHIGGTSTGNNPTEIIILANGQVYANNTQASNISVGHISFLI